MTDTTRLTYKTTLILTLAGAIAIASSLPRAVFGQTPASDATASIQFKPPRDPAPGDTLGGGIRGNIRFVPPKTSAPGQTAGGGVRGDIQFAPPRDPAPGNAVGGGIRGEISFRPPGNPAPDRTVGSGIRGDTVTEVVPLLPETNSGYTVSGHPTIYLYVPPTSARKVFFSIQDENFQPQYQTVLNISGQGGIVSITLPDDAPELKIGQYYAWFFAPIESDGILLPDNYSVSGWIKRVEPPVASSESAASTPLERAALYAKEGIWYDTLSILANEQQAQPDNAALAKEWKALLAQVGLETFADRAIAERL